MDTAYVVRGAFLLAFGQFGSKSILSRPRGWISATQMPLTPINAWHFPLPAHTALAAVLRSQLPLHFRIL